MLPRVTVAAKEKHLFERGLRQILAFLNKDERTKYLTYYKQLFSKKSKKFVAQNYQEKVEIENYLRFAKDMLRVLILQQKNNKEIKIDIVELLTILEKYANTDIGFEEAQDNESDN